MAGEEKVVILGIELDVSQLVTAAAEARKEVDSLKAKQKELTDAGMAGTEAFEENAAALRAATQVYKDTTKLIDNAKKAREAETGSIEEMRAELAIATKEYNGLSKEQRSNTEQGQKLQSRIAGLSGELKKNESAIGDNRRNVGNYTGSLNVLQQGMSSLSPSLASASQGVSSLGKQFLILLANPIVALIAAIVAVIVALGKALMSNDSFMDEFNARFEQVSAIIDVVRQRLVAFANGLIEFFKGNFSEGLDQMANSFSGVGDQIAAATKAAYEYSFALDAIEDSETNLISTRADNANKIAKLEFNAANSAKFSLAERKKFLEEAIALSEEEAKTNVKLSTDKLNAELKYLAAKNKVTEEEILNYIRLDDASQKSAQGQIKTLVDNNKDKIKEIEQFYADAVNADTKYFEENKRNIGKLSSFNKEQQEASKKAAEQKKKEEDEKQKAIQKTLKADQDALKAKEQQAAEFAKLSKAELDMTLEFVDIEQKEKLAALKQQLANKEITEQEFAERARQLQLETLNRQLADIEQYTGTVQDAETMAAEKRAEIANFVADTQIEANRKASAEQKKEVDKQIAEAQRLAQTSEAFISGVGNVFAQSLTEQGLDIKKFNQGIVTLILDTVEKIAIAQIASSTAQSLAQPDSIATFGTTGVIRAGILTGLIKAAIAVAKSQVGKLEFGGMVVPKAEKGMIIGGEPHSRGGTQFFGSDGTRFEAEKDELLAVVNKRSTRMLNGLSYWNQLGGGVNFFEKGGLQYLADGGFAGRSLSAPIDSQFEAANRTREAILNLPSPIVIVQDINEAQYTDVKVRSRAEL